MHNLSAVDNIGNFAYFNRTTMMIDMSIILHVDRRKHDLVSKYCEHDKLVFAYCNFCRYIIQAFLNELFMQAIGNAEGVSVTLSQQSYITIPPSSKSIIR